MRTIDKNNVYGQLIDFYQKVLEAQSSHRPHVETTATDKSEISLASGFPLLDKREFIIELDSSASLFKALCQIGKEANETMRRSILAIEGALKANELNLEELLRRYYDDAGIQKISQQFHIDLPVLRFLVHLSILPSVTAQAEKLRDKTAQANHLSGGCPICGSPPFISGLDAQGRRRLICSFCMFSWPSELLICPFCGNRDHAKLHFLYEEGNEESRVDLCDNCRKYIKTVDTRKLGYEPDFMREDITTLHLDMLAGEEGFSRGASSPSGF